MVDPVFQHKKINKKNISAVIKTLVTFHYTGWLIGIRIMDYYKPGIDGKYNTICTADTQGFARCSEVDLVSIGSASWEECNKSYPPPSQILREIALFLINSKKLEWMPHLKGSFFSNSHWLKKTK